MFQFTAIRLQATALAITSSHQSRASLQQLNKITSCVDFISSKLKRKIKLKRPTTVREILANAIKLSCTMKKKVCWKFQLNDEPNTEKKRVSSTDFFPLEWKMMQHEMVFSRVLCLPPPSLKNERQDIIIGKNNNPEKSPCIFLLMLTFLFFRMEGNFSN